MFVTPGSRAQRRKQRVFHSPRLLGRGTAGAGLAEEIVLGTGLSMSGLTLNATTGAATTITVANESADTTCFPLFVTAATGDLGPKSNAGLTFNSSTGVLAATGFSGPLTGNVTGNVSGSSGSCTGNAATATALQNARTIGGVSFDGTANITVATATGGFTVSGGDLAIGANNMTMTGALAATGARVSHGWFTDITCTNAIAADITGNAATVTTNANLTGQVTSVGNAATLDKTAITGQTADASPDAAADYVLTYDASAASLKKVLISNLPAGGTPTIITVANEATDTTCFLAFFTAATGDLGPKTNAALAFNSNTGLVTLGGALTIATNTAITDGYMSVTRSTGVPLATQNTQNVASANVAQFVGGRSTPAANDEIYAQLILNNSTPSSKEFGRLTCVATDVTAATEDGRLSWSVIIAGTLAEKLRLEGSALTPAANDGTALGTTALMWSDLFLASGAVVNFNNGDVTITHGTNAIDVAGATVSLFGAAESQLVAAVGGAGVGLDNTFVNDIVNGSGSIWQRRGSATSTNPTDDTYAWDRWNVLTQTAAVEAFQGAFDRATSGMKLNQSQAAAQRMGMEQILPYSSSFSARSRSKSFSFEMKITNSQAVRWALLEWTGTGDVVTSDVVNDWTSSTYTASNFFIANITVALTDHTTPAANTPTRVTGTASISSSCNNLILFVWTEGTAAQNVSLYVTEVTMCDGVVIPTWMPPNPAIEWTRCQYYGYRPVCPSSATGLIAHGFRGSTTISDYYLPFPVEMRAEPTLSHNVTAWATANPTTTQIASFDPAAAAFITITGALTLPIVASTTQAIIRATAGTSWSGTNGDALDLRIGPDVTLFFDAEL